MGQSRQREEPSPWSHRRAMEGGRTEEGDFHGAARLNQFCRFEK